MIYLSIFFSCFCLLLIHYISEGDIVLLLIPDSFSYYLLYKFRLGSWCPSSIVEITTNWTSAVSLTYEVWHQSDPSGPSCTDRCRKNNTGITLAKMCRELRFIKNSILFISTVLLLYLVMYFWNRFYIFCIHNFTINTHDLVQKFASPYEKSQKMNSFSVCLHQHTNTSLNFLSWTFLAF